MSIVEFRVERVEERDGGIAAVGRVNRGVIEKSMLLTVARYDRENNRDASSLCVERITTYRRDVDKLPEGMTGEIFLSGSGDVILLAGDLLESSRSGK
jgi:hypothetical protein